ncbi:hypothetical protein BC332_30131 [Capsicum chinense]|nr:hypothetical protein BC332_30131 [Capsicum chinense]
MFEVVKQLKERRYPTYEPQSEVIDRDFDLLIISTDSDVNKFELSYVIPNMQNSPDADLIIKFDEEINLNKVKDNDEMVVQEDPSSIETLGEEMDARKHIEVKPLVMIFYSQGTLIGKDNVVAVEENNEPYEPIDRGKRVQDRRSRIITRETKSN